MFETVTAVVKTESIMPLPPDQEFGAPDPPARTTLRPYLKPVTPSRRARPENPLRGLVIEGTIERPGSVRLGENARP